MFVDLDCTGAGAGQVLPDLATVDGQGDPHLITAAARTAANIELRICTSVFPYDVAAEQWLPAAAGFNVTVVVRTVDTATGEPRYLTRAEPDEWVRAIFSTVEATGGYFLGAVDPDTGVHCRGQFAYRLYLDTDRRAIPAPRQLVTFPQYLLPTIDIRGDLTLEAPT
ncbi:N-formylglutamate amidohydrolase [Rhodococcus sp. NPDC057014]|uniref:N-formylglutamate amidohydrolase n=1 Tax=Rhodococcus sp. NPDC057014 TaxID=3346000 RepID=UPI00362B6E73